MKTSAIAAPLLLALCGCSGDTEEQLIGGWTASVRLTPEQAGQLFGGALPPGVTAEVTESSRVTYHPGGKYDSDGEFAILFSDGSLDTPVRFLWKDAGTWSVHEDTLVHTTVDGLLRPADDVAASFLTEIPTFATMMEPVEGEAVSYRIVEVAATSMELELQGTGLRISCRKNP